MSVNYAPLPLPNYGPNKEWLRKLSDTSRGMDESAPLTMEIIKRATAQMMFDNFNYWGALPYYRALNENSWFGISRAPAPSPPTLPLTAAPTMVSESSEPPDF